MSIAVAVAVPVHNRRETTLAGLRSLLDADRTGIDLHVVVVDDGSADGTGDAIRSEFPEIEVITADGTLYYAGGTNRAIESAMTRSPKYVLAMNDDATFDKHFLTSLVECAEKHPGSIVGALLTQQGREGYAFQVGQQWSLRFGGWRIPQDLRTADLPDRAFVVECIVGNCVLVPARAIREVGVLNQADFPYFYGDSEWSVRMRKAGWTQLIDPHAIIECEPNTYPPALREIGTRGTLRVLFVDQRHPLNLRRQWIQMRSTAPSRPQAVVAYAVCLTRFLLRGVGIGSWPRWPDPPVDYVPVDEVAVDEVAVDEVAVDDVPVDEVARQTPS